MIIMLPTVPSASSKATGLLLLALKTMFGVWLIFGTPPLSPYQLTLGM
jgi:hypothetical protein